MPTNPSVRDDVITLLQSIESEVRESRAETTQARDEMALRDRLYLAAFEGMDSRQQANKKANEDLRQRFESYVRKTDGRFLALESSTKNIADDSQDVLRQQSDHNWKRESDMAAVAVHMSKVEKGFLKMALEIKKDPMILIIAGIMIVGVGVMISIHIVEWYIGIGFLSATALPSVFGKKKVSVADQLKALQKEHSEKKENPDEES